MIRIGTLAQDNQMLQYLQQTQSQTDVLSAQISTGLKSQTFSGISADASRLVNLQSSVAEHQNYLDTINTLDTRTQVMNLALTNIQSLAHQFASLLPGGAYDTTAPTINQRAQQFLTTLGSYLDTQDGSRYIFSGSKASTAPWDPTGLPNPGDLSTSVSGSPPSGYYAGDSITASAQIDQAQTVTYGIVGNDPSIEQFVRTLNFFANLPGPLDPTNAADQANVSQALSLMNSAQNGLTALNTTLSLNVAQIDSTAQVHQSAVDLANNEIGNIENVDPATVITQLNTLQTQMQASYHTLSMIQQLSLVDYLK